MARQLRVVPAPESRFERAPDLRESVRAAIDAMTWLTDSDAGLKAVALRQAEEIETAIDRAQLLSDLYDMGAGDSLVYQRLRQLEAQCEVARVVAAIGPQLQATLRELGGSPAMRKILAPPEAVGARLKSLRSAARPA